MANIRFVCLLLLTIHYAFSVFSAEIYFRWCTLPGEKTKCDDFMKHVNMTAQNMSLAVKTSCVDGTDPDDCMEKIKNSEADLVTLSGGDTYSAGERYNFKVIVSEQYGEYEVKYYSVAIVKKSNTGFDLKGLKGKKSCHTQAEKNAGWKISVGYLLRSKIMDPVDCKSPYKAYFSASKFFSESCVPGTKDKVSAAAYEKVKNLCSLCAGTGNDKCSTNSSVNEYVSHKGAFKCMKDGKGDVAFVKLQVDSPADFYDKDNQNDYQFLCQNGGRKGIEGYKECNLGASPAHAVVTRKDNSDIEDIIKILKAMSYKYGKTQTDWSKFQLFNSSKYNDGEDLIFKDATTALKGIAVDKQNYMGYLGDIYGKNVKALTSCDAIVSTSSATSPVTALMLFTAALNALLM